MRTSPAGAAKGRAGGVAPGAPVCATGQNNLQNTGSTWALASIRPIAVVISCSRLRTRAEHETPALIAGPPAPVRPARHATGRRPASASTGVPALRLGALVLQQPGPLGVLTFCCVAQAPRGAVIRGDAGSLTRCFAAPNPWTTDLPKPILAACMQGCSPPPRLSWLLSLRVCMCKVISCLSLSCQPVCLSAAHSAGLFRLGGFAVSTVAATPLH